MFHLKRWSDKQRKANAIRRQRAEAADDDRAIKYPNLRRKSYSATHKPYERTAYGNLWKLAQEEKKDGESNTTTEELPEL